MCQKVKYIIVFIIGMIVCSSLSVYATSIFMASQIEYTKKSDNTTVTLDYVLDELYTSASSISNLQNEVNSLRTQNQTYSGQVYLLQKNNTRLQNELDTYKTLKFVLRSEAYSDTRKTRAYLRLDDFSSKYTYVKASSPSYETGENLASPTELTLTAWKESTNQTITMSAGTKYQTADLTSIILDSKSSVDNKKARAYVTLTFSN